MKNNKGLSQVITIVVMVVLVLIAIAIIWGVYGTIISDQAGSADVLTKCNMIEVRPISASCPSGICNVTLQRSNTGGEIAGVKVLFIASNGASKSHEVLKEIEPMSTEPISNFNTGLTDVKSIEVSAYLTNSIGENVLCSQKFAYNVN